MKRCRILVAVTLLIVLSFYSSTTYAQQDDKKEISKKREELISEIKALNSDIETLDKAELKYKSESENLDQQIASVEEQIAEIQKMIDFKNRDALTLGVDSLEKVSCSLDSIVKDLRSKVSNRKQTLAKLQTEVSDLDVYSELKKNEIYDANLAILAKPYSHITDEDFAKISKNVDMFAYRADYEEYKKRVDAATKNRLICNRVHSALNSPYKDDVRATLRKELIAMLRIEADNIELGKFKLTKEQYEEVDLLDIKLSRYKNGIAELKSIVERVNSNARIKELREKKDKEQCLEIMSYIVLPKNDETKEVYEKYFEQIPYLKKMIDEYWNDLNKNPFDRVPAEEKIIQM